MSTLADVKLPQSTKEKAIEAQAKRIKSLSDSFVTSDSESLKALGDLLNDIANELDALTEGGESDCTVSEEIQNAVRRAVNAATVA